MLRLRVLIVLEYVDYSAGLCDVIALKGMQNNSTGVYGLIVLGYVVDLFKHFMIVLLSYKINVILCVSSNGKVNAICYTLCGIKW